ncbi:MAG: stage II sporulation protein M [Tissierellia bacterium]|nr:stage II sporulation protein M [Tissierellia bacterium]
MQLKIKTLCKRHLQNNFVLYFILVIALVIGIIIGAILANRLESDKGIEVANYMNVFLKHINEGNYYFKDIFISSLFLNLKRIFIIWLFGLLGLGLIVIPLIMCWNGINIGFIVGFLVKGYGLKGFIFTLIGLLPQYLIVLPSLLAITALALSNANNRKKLRRDRDYIKKFADYSILILVFFVILVFGCIIEGFYTPYFIKFMGV